MKHVRPIKSWSAALSCALVASTGAITSVQAAANADVGASNSASRGAGGLATVSFVKPDSFVDARDSSGSSEDNLKVLAQHLQRLAKRYLAEGQVVQIEVLDVDLAGRTWPFRAGPELRVIRDTIDWPRIKLRYVLEVNGAVLQRGEETLTDMNFTSRALGGLASESLPYEKRMLNQWFTTRFVARPAADH